MECGGIKPIDNSKSLGGPDLTNITTNTLQVLQEATINDATFIGTTSVTDITSTGLGLFNDITATGTVQLGDLNLDNIHCQTLEASSYARVKNPSDDTLSLLMTPVTDPNPRRGIIRSAATAFGIDMETEGSNKSIKIQSNKALLGTTNSLGPSYISVGSSSSNNAPIEILANQAVSITSTTSEIVQSAYTNLSLYGRDALTFQSTLGTVNVNSLISMNLTCGPSVTSALAGININSATNVMVGTLFGGIRLAAGFLVASVPNPGDVIIQASQTGGLGGAIIMNALSTFPGIQPPNAIALTTDVGVIALTSGAGGVAVTTGLGLVSVSTGGGAIQLRTGVGLGGLAAAILLETVIGGGITLKSGTDAINLLAGFGGINAGTATFPSGQFSVYTNDGVTATGNIDMSTHTGGFGGAGNITLNARSGGTGNIFFQSKGTLQISSNNTSAGGINLDTSASSAQVYDWKFPSGSGTVGQVLSSNGPSTAQSWANVPTFTNGNISANNIFLGYFVVTTTPNPYDMLITSPSYTRITRTGGTANIVLPDATTLPLGAQYYFNCDGDTTVNIKRHSGGGGGGGATIVSLILGAFCTLVLEDNTTPAGVWDYHPSLPKNVSWGELTMTTTSTMSALNTVNASGLNTGSLRTLGGASISKRIYIGDTLYTNWAGTAVNRSSIFCSPGVNGTEASIGFNQNVNNTGTLWVVGHNVDSSGSDTLAFYSSTYNSWIAKFDGTGKFSTKGIISTPSIALTGSVSGVVTLASVSGTYTLTVPQTAGTSGDFLISKGGGALEFRSILQNPLNILLGAGYASSTRILDLKQQTLPNNSYVSMEIGVGIFDTVNNATILQHNYVGTGSTSNYFGIGTFSNLNVFRFYPGQSTFECPRININGWSDYLTPVLQVSNTSNFSSELARFLQPSANNNTFQTILFGKNSNTRNCVAFRFNYVMDNDPDNNIALSLNGTGNLPEVQIRTTRVNIYTAVQIKGKTFLNYGQGVPNGDAALVISPTLQGGQASMDFTTDLFATGRTWRIGQNVNGQGDDNFCFYNSTYNGNVGYIDNLANLRMKGGVVTPNIYSETNLEIQASDTPHLKINVHCGSYQSGGIYLNSGIANGQYPNYGSTNIGNINLGNSLFVGNQQENYFGTVSANGIVNIAASNSNNQFITFYDKNAFGNPSSAMGSVTANLAGGVNFNTTSDYRIKENVVEITDSFSIISKLRPVTFNAINYTETVYGFIAHEVQEVFPQAVVGEKDALDEYGKPKLQQLSISSFTPLLTKAVQELHQLLSAQQLVITSLVEKIAVLEQK
jgi:hypothetical protein